MGSRSGRVNKLEGGSYGGHRCAAESLARSDGSIRRPGTAHTSREGDNSAVGERPTENTKRSKFMMIGAAAAAAAETTIQPPAVLWEAWQTGGVEYGSCGHKTPPSRPPFHFFWFPLLLQQSNWRKKMEYSYTCRWNTHQMWSLLAKRN
jgi:hypothetical protein